MNRWLLFVLVVVAAAMVAGALALASMRPRCDPGDCVAALRAYRPPEATRLFAADGTVLADLSPQRRVVVPLDEIPPLVRDAFVAVEDRRFWRHDGIDPRGVARAVWRDVTSLSFREGFSTITMQLARNVFPEALPRARLLRRKVWEVVLAHRIERRFEKAEILELYLNQIYLGAGLYGVEAAARGYFGRSVGHLDEAQTALLVALVRSPEGYNPRRRPMRAVQRRNIVLGVMAREGVISESAAEAARARPLGLAPTPDGAGPAPYFVQAVRRELRARYGPQVDIMGLRVHTTLDPALQRAAHRALNAQIRRIESGGFGRYSHAVPGNGALPPDTAPASPFLQGMVVAMDPATGRIGALVGGRDFALSQYDRALQARRQPGSTFKPIVYAAAIERGVTLADRLEAGPVLVQDQSGPAWRPDDHVADTAALSVRRAMALSSNHAAVRLGRWTGEDRVADMGRRLGLTTPIPPYPSIHLGAAEVVPAELVAAFATFGNGGYRVAPRLIDRVETADGRLLWAASAQRERVLDEGVAFLTTSMLRSVVDEGTASTVRGAGFFLPAAGKTGTSNEGKDAWFVGMTPDLAAGIWIGFDRPAPIGVAGGYGGRLAAPVWADFMKEAYESRPAPPDWSPPASVAAVRVDVQTGQLATAGCPDEHVSVEYFLRGTEPAEFCRLHQESLPERLFRRLWRGVRGVFQS